MQQSSSNSNVLSNGTPNGSVSSLNGETVTSSPLNDPLVAGGSVAVYANGGIMSITSTGSGAPTQTTAATPTALMASSIVSSVIPPQTSSAQSAAAMAAITAAAGDPSKSQPKRLHVSNIPFRFRDPDLRTMFGVSNDDSRSVVRVQRNVSMRWKFPTLRTLQEFNWRGYRVFGNFVVAGIQFCIAIN